jgi:acyl-CoA dehydrogenase
VAGSFTHNRYQACLYSETSSTAEQMGYCMKMIRKPIADPARYERVWNNHVYALKGSYEMKR